MNTNELAEASYRLGHRAMARNEYQAALHHYTDAITRLDHSQYYLSRATTFQKLGDYQRMIDDAKKSTELDRQLVEGYLKLATGLAHLGRYDEATNVLDYVDNLRMDEMQYTTMESLRVQIQTNINNLQKLGQVVDTHSHVQNSLIREEREGLKRRRLTDQGILTLSTGRVQVTVQKNNIRSVQVFLVKKNSQELTFTGIQFLNGEPVHDYAKLSQLFTPSTINTNIVTLSDIKPYTLATTFSLQIHIPVNGQREGYGRWKQEYAYYKLGLFGESKQEAYLSHCIKVNQENDQDITMDVGFEQLELPVAQFSCMDTESILPSSGCASMPCDVIITSQSIVSPAALWRDEWNVTFGNTNAEMRGVTLVNSNNEMSEDESSKSRLRISVTVPQKSDRNTVPVVSLFTHGTIISRDKVFHYIEPLQQLNQVMDTCDARYAPKRFEWTICDKKVQQATTIEQTLSRNQAYNFMSGFVFAVRKHAINYDRDALMLCLMQAAKEYVGRHDVYNRNVCFYITTHPSCTSDMKHTLFNDVGYDRSHKDCYGFTCDDWQASILDTFIYREFETMLSKLDQVQEWSEYTEGKYFKMLLEGAKSSQIDRYGNGNLMLAEETWTSITNSTPVRILLKSKGQTEVLQGMNTQNHGVLTVAFNIGEIALEFTEQGLVRTYRAKEDRAVVAIEVGHIIEQNWETEIEKISNLAASWSGGKQFDQFTCNSMHFVKVCCQEIHCTPVIDGQIGLAFSTIEQVGYALAALRITDELYMGLGQELLAEYGVENDMIMFPTHARLDEFVHAAAKTCPNMFKDELTNQYLKGIDRSFHHRLEYEKDCDHSICDPSGKYDCAYGDTGANPLSRWGKTTRQPKRIFV
jgi:tetratricopeptide (TPR) repeat protein